MKEQAKIPEYLMKRCSCDCKALPPFTMEETSEASIVDTSHILEELHKHSGRGLELLQEGMNVELEHCDITHGDLYLTARIALAHLKEDPDYYAKLKKAGL